MGEPVVPLILMELEREPNVFWSPGTSVRSRARTLRCKTLAAAVKGCVGTEARIGGRGAAMRRRSRAPATLPLRRYTMASGTKTHACTA